MHRCQTATKECPRDESLKIKIPSNDPTVVTTDRSVTVGIHQAFATSATRTRPPADAKPTPTMKPPSMKKKAASTMYAKIHGRRSAMAAACDARRVPDEGFTPPTFSMYLVRLAGCDGIVMGTVSNSEALLEALFKWSKLTLNPKPLQGRGGRRQALTLCSGPPTRREAPEGRHAPAKHAPREGAPDGPKIMPEAWRKGSPIGQVGVSQTR